MPSSLPLSASESLPGSVKSQDWNSKSVREFHADLTSTNNNTISIFPVKIIEKFIVVDKDQIMEQF